MVVVLTDNRPRWFCPNYNSVIGACNEGDCFCNNHWEINSCLTSNLSLNPLANPIWLFLGEPWPHILNFDLLLLSLPRSFLGVAFSLSISRTFTRTHHARDRLWQPVPWHLLKIWLLSNVQSELDDVLELLVTPVFEKQHHGLTMNLYLKN